ncbi:hypothetical protein KC323_g20 [Hortaea werneckii]|nr:hypothetical protein KC323_g20 [Hortaea werneckii]
MIQLYWSRSGLVKLSLSSTPSVMYLIFVSLLVHNTFRDRHGRYTTRLCTSYEPRSGIPVFHQELSELRRFSGAGLAHDDPNAGKTCLSVERLLRSSLSRSSNTRSFLSLFLTFFLLSTLPDNLAALPRKHCHVALRVSDSTHRIDLLREDCLAVKKRRLQVVYQQVDSHILKMPASGWLPRHHCPVAVA